MKLNYFAIVILLYVNVFASQKISETQFVKWPDNVFTVKKKMWLGYKDVLDFIVDDFNMDGIQDVATMRIDDNIQFCLSVFNTKDYKYIFKNLQLDSLNNYMKIGGKRYVAALKGHPVYKYATFRDENKYLNVDFYDYRFRMVNTLKTDIRIDLTSDKVIYPFDVFICDWNSDFSPDLIFALNAGKIAKPRAVFSYNIVSGKEIFRYNIAPMIMDFNLTDFNKDGVPEILFSTAGASDGDYFGAFARDSSYLVILKNNLSKKILWKFGGESSYVDFKISDITGDGFVDIVAYGFSMINKEKTPSKLVLIDGQSLEIIASYTNTIDIKEVQIVSNGPGKIPSIWVFDRKDKIDILEFNSSSLEFQNIKEVKAKGVYRFINRDDINGDGIPEMFFLDIFSHQLDIVNNEALLLGRIPISENSHGAKLEVLNTSTNKERHYILLYLAFTGNQFYRIDLPVSKIYPEKGVILKDRMIFLLSFLCIMAFLLLVWIKRRNRFMGNVAKSEKIGFLLVDNDLKVRAYNQTFLELLQIKNIKISKRKLDDILGDRVSSLTTALNLFMFGVSDYSLNEIQLNIKGQIRDLAMEFFRCHHIKKPQWIEILLIDISETTQAERLKAWGALAQQMMHKTKTPLGTIMLSLQRLRDTYRKNMSDKIDDLDIYLNPALQEVRKVRDHVNMFVKFANINNIEKEKKDLNYIIKDLFEEYKSRAPEGVNWKIETENKVIWVLIDELQFKEAVINILDNAVTAVKGEGSINISVNIEAHPLREYGKIDFASIEISDNGVGINSKNIEKLFTSGYTTSDHGSGMGLVITKNIIEMHEGEIFINSTENLGTTVYIRLPIVK